MAVNEYLLPEMLAPDAVTTERISEKTRRKLERYKAPSIITASF
jgi:hypothetical protein